MFPPFELTFVSERILKVRTVPIIMEWFTAVALRRQRRSIFTVNKYSRNSKNYG